MLFIRSQFDYKSRSAKWFPCWAICEDQNMCPAKMFIHWHIRFHSLSALCLLFAPQLAFACRWNGCRFKVTLSENECVYVCVIDSYPYPV